jgi:outer membrane lipopolysaccharide assembly protein LptE/RlpB
MTTYTSLRTFLILGLMTALVACGFKLRGQAYLPPEMRTIYLQSNSPYGPFTEQLRQTLVGMRIQLVDNAQAAPITLNILSEGTHRQLSGLSTTSQINTYILIYTVNYQISDQAGRVLGNTRSVSARRNQTVDANQVLGTNSEYILLEEEMRRETIYLIISQLGSKSVRKHLGINTTVATTPAPEPAKK